MPVFNGFDALSLCFESLASIGLPSAWRILLIDDASTDHRIAALMAEFRKRMQDAVDVVRNESNLGFVGTVNRAMSMVEGDVLLLNSDTVVTPNWLVQILRCAESDPKIGTITPWSNNAEICSLPRFCQNNAVPNNADEIALKIAALDSTAYPELPTAVGFCMWIRRAALNMVGDFDQATFGRGYGEENDFCLRIAAHGWRNVLCDNAYVVHQGGVSFSQTGEKPGGENLKRLLARYPRYNQMVAEFIAADPLKPIRDRICQAIDFEQGNK